jgi:hypothetical protein
MNDTCSSITGYNTGTVQYGITSGYFMLIPYDDIMIL